MIWQNICFNTGNLHISLWINDLLSLYANEYYESLPLKKSKQYLLKTRIFLETTSITNVFRSVLKKLSLKTVKIVWRNKFSGKTRLDLLSNLWSNQWKITTFNGSSSSYIVFQSATLVKKDTFSRWFLQILTIN